MLRSPVLYVPLCTSDSTSVSSVVTGIRSNLKRSFRAMPVPTQSRPHAQKHVERDGVISVGNIKHGRLRVNCHISAQAELPEMVLNQVAHPAEGVRANAIGVCAGLSGNNSSLSTSSKRV